MNYLNSYYNQFISNFNEIDDYTQELNNLSLILLKVFNIGKILLSEIFFSFIIIIFDSLLFNFIKSIFVKKRNRNNKHMIKNIILNRRKLKHDKISQKRISSMIICNAINFIVFRTPSMILSFYGYNYRYDSSKNEHLPDLFSYNICRTRKFCNLVADVAFLLYLISFLVQFLIFYILDRNFKEVFKSIFSWKKIKIYISKHFKN